MGVNGRDPSGLRSIWENLETLWTYRSAAWEGFKEGVQKGSVITLDAITCGSFDELHQAAESYDEWYYNIPRGTGTVFREGVIIASGLGLSSKFAKGGKVATIFKQTGKAKLYNFLAAGCTANASATLVSTGVSMYKQIESGEYDYTKMGATPGTRLGSFFGGGFTTFSSNLLLSGAFGGSTYSITQQGIDKRNDLSQFSYTEVATDATFGAILSWGTKFLTKTQNIDMTQRQLLTIDKLARNKDLSKAQKEALKEILKGLGSQQSKEALKSFWYGTKGEVLDELVEE